MALINCPECGKEVSDKAVACPNCGNPITEQVDSSTPASVSNAFVTPTKPPEGSQKASTQKKRVAIGIIIGVVVIAAVLLFAFFFNNAPSAKDHEVFTMVVKAASNFKDPSSVRLLGGTLSLSGEILWAKVSAANSYGAKVTTNYSIFKDGFALSEEDAIENGASEIPERYYAARDDFNVSAVNKLLEDHWK